MNTNRHTSIINSNFSPLVSLPSWPWQIVYRQAQERGSYVWLVGGAVRDLLRRRMPHDWDFAVDRDALRLARQVADVLGGAYFPLDADRETGRVIVQSKEGIPQVLDFALLRGAGLAEDLRMRDFTINAMAVGNDGALIDVIGGYDDLLAGRIRATSERAFQDDPVRLLRAVRLAAQFHFEVDYQTMLWLQRDSRLLMRCSAERVRDEFLYLLMLPGAVRHLRSCDQLGLLSQVIPELEPLKGMTQSPPHRFDVWQHVLYTVDTLEGVLAVATGQIGAKKPPPGPADIPPTVWEDISQALGRYTDRTAAHLSVEVSGGRDRMVLLKLAALLHDVGKAHTRSQDADGRIHFYRHEQVGAGIAAERLRELRFSGDEIARMRVLVGQHARPAHLSRAERITRRAIYRYFRATGCAGLDVALFSLADHLASRGPHLDPERWSRRLDVVQTLLTHWFEHYDETVAPSPLVTGRDLMSHLDLPSGPEIGRLLEAIREAQAEGSVSTRAEALRLAKTLTANAEK